jgi:hypothetical protein
LHGLRSVLMSSGETVLIPAVDRIPVQNVIFLTE